MQAMAFTGLPPEEAVTAIGKMCDMAIVKTGKTGSRVCRNNQVTRIFALKAHSIDTTGAGDSYAAGFLFGLTQDLPIEKCGQIASLVAARTVEFMGAKIPDAEWPVLLEKVKSITEV